MVLRGTIGTDGMALPIATSLVVVAWTVVAFFVYRDYRVNLLANLRHRALDPSELAIEGSSTLEAIHRLVDSPDERDVRLGLDTLTATGHEDLHACLLSLATDDRASVRSDVLDRLVSVDPIAAASVARRGLVDPNPEVRAASVRTLGLVGRAADLDSISARLEDPSAEVQVAAVTSMFELGGDAASARVSLEVEALVGHESSEGLIVAARMLGACDHGASIDRSLLSTLLSAADHDLVNAALRAIRWPDDAGALHDVMRHLDHRSTAEAAVDALARSGDTALSLADEGLRGNFHLGQHGCEQLARVCRVTGGSKAADVLRRHVEHRDREVGLAVMNALAVIVTGMTTSEESVLRADLEHACHVVRAIVTLEHSPGAGALREALRDELDLLRRRVLAVLSIHHGVGELNTVGFQLAQQSTNLHSIAMEWLDVTLVGIERPSLALLEPRASLADRHASLTRWFPLPSISPETVLIDVVEDPDDRWRRPWLTACALLAGADSPELGLEHLAETLRESPVEEHRHHWHIVSDTIAGIRRRRSLEAA
ncbi:MAG TPA: hypothetical protein VHQ23_01465, partial [Ilumatobacteraceae bacterium]|nr:hypothetical protein [Ilumatobacteraceae bacterium]